ncbi:MAG: NAD(P)-dependent alcohol dehydrogenase [Candidatus Dormibacteraeota bacterium]|nr:NAD(P)-dependent alcohol dehydrogenase [Candidatus Dormibacteraeota bacterium]
MRAVVQDAYGDAPETVLRLDQIPLPTVGGDEVLVRVRAAGVDRGTWHLMVGRPYLMRYIGFGLHRPKSRVPGLDVAGIVEAVGKNVTQLVPGQEVFGTCRGAFAEYAVADPKRLTTKPVNLSFEQAAALAVSGTAALQAVRDKAHVTPGQQVLVIGASGGVGSFAVQLAKACGAEVTGVCSTGKMDFVRSIGADHVIDYTSGTLNDGRQRYEAIIDVGGNRSLKELRRALTPRGTLVITGGENGGAWLGGIERNFRAALVSPFVGQKLVAFISRLRQRDLETLRDMAQSHALTPAVEQSFPLSEASSALRYLIDGRIRGKIVVTL